MASSSLNEGNLEKRLQNVTNTQESIQTLSLWCLHHKAHYFKIVQIWTKVFKTAKVNHRLALFYLANDVIQNSKRKGFVQFGEAWMPSIKETIPLVTEEKIKAQMDRILTIWEERSVYDLQFIKEIRSLFVTVNPGESSDAKLLVDFKPQKLVDKLKKFKKLETEAELKQKQFTSLKLDVCSTETLKQLKDKAHGTKFTKDFEDATNKLDEFVQILQRCVKERKGLIEMLEESTTFYDTQRKEAKIVANAYKNFGSRVKNLQGKLEEMVPILSSPVPSPSFDAPSPDDSSVESSPSRIGKKDNTEAVDMEMSDDDCDNTKIKDDSSSISSAPSPEGSPVGLSSSPIQPCVPVISKSLTPDTKATACFLFETLRKTTNTIATQQTSSSTPQTMTSSLDIRLSNLMHNIPNFATSLFSGRPLVDTIKRPSNATNLLPEGCTTPLKDEESCAGSATPLQDENREMNAKTKIEVRKSNIIGSLHQFSSEPALKSFTSAKYIGMDVKEPRPTYEGHNRSGENVMPMPITPPLSDFLPSVSQSEDSKTIVNNHGQIVRAAANHFSGSSGNAHHSNIQFGNRFPPVNGDEKVDNLNMKPTIEAPYRRNSNIVQLTPSPRISPKIDNEQEQLSTWIIGNQNINAQEKGGKNSKLSKNLVDESDIMAPIRPLGDAVFLPSTLNPPKKSTITINIRNPKTQLTPVKKEFKNELPLAVALLKTPNTSNLRTIVPFGPDVIDDDNNVNVDDSSSRSVQPMYSKIETLDSSRDSYDYWDHIIGSNPAIRSISSWSSVTQPTINQPQMEHQCQPQMEHQCQPLQLIPPQQHRHPSGYNFGQGFRPPWRGEPKPHWRNPDGPLPKRPLLMSTVPPARWAHYRPQY